MLALAVICYGLYLTFSSALCPASCLPPALPLATFASHLGTTNPTGDHCPRSAELPTIL